MDVDRQRQRNINQLILLKEDLADTEADLQAATTDSYRLRLRKDVARILHEIKGLESLLGEVIGET